MKLLMRVVLGIFLGMFAFSQAFGAATVIKRKIYKEDFDLTQTDDNTAETVNVQTSTGAVMPVTKLNASQIPYDNSYSRTIRPGDIVTKGPWIDVRVFKAKCDGATDDTEAIKAAIAFAERGDELYFPGLCMVSEEISLDGKSHLSFRARDWAYTGISSGTTPGLRSVLNMTGSANNSFRDFMVASDNSADPPDALLILGRNASGHGADNGFDRVGFRGYASKAFVYSIASETNSYINSIINSQGGGAKYLFYTSATDDLSLGGLTSSTNLTGYMNHFWMIQNAAPDNTAAVIYIKGSPSAGGFVFSNGYLASNDGSLVELAGGATENAFWKFTGMYGETISGGLDYGVLLSGAVFSNLQIDGFQFGIHPARSLYADDGNTLTKAHMVNMKSNSDNGPSLYSITDTYWEEMGQNAELRNAITGSTVKVGSEYTFTYPYGLSSKGGYSYDGGRKRHYIQALEEDSATPSVRNGELFYCDPTGPLTITNFLDNAAYQEITVIFDDGNTTIGFDNAGLIRGNNGVPWTANTGDMMRCIYNARWNIWGCVPGWH